MDWLGPIVWEYYAATEGAGTLVEPGRVAAPAGHRRQGRPARPRPHPRRRRAPTPPRGEIGTVYLKAPPDDDRFEYFKAPEKTAGAYAGDYFTLGDVGYVDADGYLFLTDRSAHLIISGGVNIYPAEVEAVLHRPSGGRRRRRRGPARRRVGRDRGGRRSSRSRASNRRTRSPPSSSSGAGTASRTTSVPAASTSSRRCPGTTTASSTSTSCASSSGTR